MKGQYLSASDPCPHVTRLDLIRAKLVHGHELENLLQHVNNCPQRPNLYAKIWYATVVEHVGFLAKDHLAMETCYRQLQELTGNYPDRVF